MYTSPHQQDHQHNDTCPLCTCCASYIHVHDVHTCTYKIINVHVHVHVYKIINVHVHGHFYNQ